MATPDLINAWLDTNIIADYNGAIPDKWRVYLIQQGYTFKSLPETQYKYFGDQGYTGTLSRRYQQWLDAVIY